MSAIARYYHQKGLKVTGYDKTPSELTHALEAEGIEVHYEDNIDYVPKNIDETLVVYTPAIPKDMGELVYVQENGYRVIKRSRMLGEIAQGQRCMAVAGTHGKTTTSSMLSVCFLEASMDPTIQVGAMLKQIDGNYRVGNSEYFILESCEYMGNFLKFNPNAEIVAKAEEYAAKNNSTITITSDVKAAVSGADVIYTDVWVSMGDEAEAEKRRADFKEYQVNQELIDLADDDVIFMHCLPVRRNMIVTDEVIEAPTSLVIPEAANREISAQVVLKRMLEDLQ